MPPLKDALRRALAKQKPRREPMDGSIRAAVLVPMLGGREPRLLFIERTAHALDPHSGQISFPGGRWHAGDTDAVATALREAEEELGLGRDAVEVLGCLAERRTITGFAITPVIGWIETCPPLTPQAAEVADCFQVSIGELSGTRENGRLEYHADGRVIWGATARITSELLELLAK